MCLGVPGRIVQVDEQAVLRTGTVDFGGTRREVCLAYVPDVRVDEYVIVHVGFALCVIDEAEAARTWTLLEEIGRLDEEIGGPDVTSGDSIVRPGGPGDRT
jgi:hydrogenase expression/formation protein HypC